MGSAATVWTSTAVLCLLPICSACTVQRAFVLDNDPPAASMWAEMPVMRETTRPASCNGPATPAASGLRPGPADPTASRPSRLRIACQEAKCKIWTDYENFYCWDVARDLLLATAAASVLANTSMDQEFRDWYQDDVKSQDTEHLCYVWKSFGDGFYFIPAVVGVAMLGRMYDDTPCGSVVGEFACRTARGYAVGCPPMVFMQYCLGGCRPGESSCDSRWKPFDDHNAVSGHAFVGAVPFITAAKMTDDPYLKAGLYLCSTLTGWSRIDHDMHYLSQVGLGWWMAYLACNAVDKTEKDFEHLTLTPVTTPEMVGIGLIYER